MSEKEATPVSLGVMLGSSEFFVVKQRQTGKEKRYSVYPLCLDDVDKVSSRLAIKAQIYNLANEDNRKLLEEILPRYVFDSDGNPMDIEKAKQDQWSLTDLRRCVEKLFDLSG
ncbi:MAG: hypothetical protein WC231_05400 [Dehalococcoidales bacterium]|nr:hypothetical protein [Dehalococcoidales bacterium]